MKLPNKGLGSAPSGLSVAGIIKAVADAGGAIDMESLFCAVGGTIRSESAMRRYQGKCDGEFMDVLDKKKRKMLLHFVNSSLVRSKNPRMAFDENGLLRIIPGRDTVQRSSAISCHPISLYYYSRVKEGRKHEKFFVLLQTKVRKLIDICHEKSDAQVVDGMLLFNVTKNAASSGSYRISIPKKLIEMLHITRSCGCELISVKSGRVTCLPVLDSEANT